MSFKVKVYQADCSIISVNKITDESAFVLKEIGSEKYHIVYKSCLKMKAIYPDLIRFKNLLESPVEIVTEKDFYYIDNKFKFKVYAKIPNKWIVRVFNEKDGLEYDFKHKDFKKVNENYYILKNYNQYTKKYNYKIKFLDFKEIEDWYYDSDQIVAECISELFGCKYYYDLHGSFRIKNKEKHTEKEKEFMKNLNEGFSRYYNGEYTFTELVVIYTKLDYSFNGFMEVFNDSLISEDFDKMTKEELKEDIIKILKSEKKSYDK